MSSYIKVNLKDDIIGEGDINEYKNIRKVKGQCQKLEKHYLRLTEEPDPITIRPLIVLKKSLPFVIGQFKNGK